MRPHGIFAAYNQRGYGVEDARARDESGRYDLPQERGFARSGESPPDLRNGFNRSQTTLNSMHRSYQNRIRDASDRQITARVMSIIHDEQGRTRLGQKVITPADEMSDADDDFIVMNTVKSVFDEDRQAQQVVIHEHHHYHDKKKKSKKKRSSSTSSSSSTESPESRKRKKEKKKSKKEKKKERKRKNLDELEESSADEGPSNRKRHAVVSDFDKKRNPWKLLRKNEWNYKPLNMVVDTHGDLENSKYDSSHRGDVPEYRSLNSEDNPFWRVFSEQFRGLLSEPANSTVAREQRSFSERVMKQWGKRPPERTFRNRTNEKSFEHYVKLSHAPCTENEEGAISLNPIKHELDEQLLGNINIEDYEHLMRSQQASYEEALESDVQARYSILQTKVINEPDNVDAWLKFVDIQREMQAKNESGDPKASVQNTKALFEKMEGVIKKALEYKNVSPSNPRAVELHLKYLKIMEDHFGPQSDAVLEKWKRCENRFVNSITMWRDNIRMRQNDRTVFDLKKMVLMGPPSESRLPLIDHCITKLVDIKNGTIKTHTMLEGTEQFLVDLLVQRCRLQVVTGHIAKAVAVMQALAEFHFFRPEIYKNFRPNTKPHLMQQKLKEGFKCFWCSGLARIGEPAANGWFRFETSDLDFQQPRDSEAEVLEQKWNSMHDEEKSLLATFKGLGLPAVEVRRRLEKFRTKWFWSPVHFKHDDERLYEHKARIVSFEELEPLLFSFTDAKYAKDLIFKLLHILGVPIPDVFIETQENVLRQFSRVSFASNSPVSMELSGFDLFVEYFVTQLAESTLMDSPRIYTALITSVSNSTLPKHKKYAALMKLVRTKIQSLKRYGKELKLSMEVQLSLYLTAFEEMVKVKQEIGDNCEEDKSLTKESVECDLCLTVLCMNLDKKHRSLWEIGETEPEDLDKRKQRLFYLRFAVFLARQLPFSTDPSAVNSVNREIKVGKGEVIGYLRTKREFLHSFFYHGRTEQVPLNQETKGTAYQYFSRRLIHPAALHLDDPLRWIGDENELVFELCSYYAYEFPIQGIPKQRFSAFVLDESSLYGSALAKLLRDRPCVQETRVLILQHIVATSSYYTPGELRRKLSDLALRFPHNIPILRALLSVGSNFYKRQFLTQYSGTDNRSRLIRTCGRIFAAFSHYTREVQRYQDQKYDNQAFRALLAQLVHILRRAAEENCDNSLPDDFIWIFLMNCITVNREMVSSRIIDEIFTLGQGRCPWSKQFLMESLRGCCEPSDSSVTTVNATIKTHGISSFCSDPEVQLLMEAL
ncbi:hypothetical protein GPALN_012999 [Globodera pallida]|nr:hypothetical protein GPALN_012999 [Globodera pallida]